MATEQVLLPPHRKYCSLKRLFVTLIVAGSVALLAMAAVYPTEIITKRSTLLNTRSLIEQNLLREYNINPLLRNEKHYGNRPVLSLNYSNANYGLENRKLSLVLWNHKFEHVFKFTDQPHACEYSFDQNMVESADFVIFHSRSLRDLTKLPPIRTMGQRWILHTKESAKYGHSDYNYLSSLANIFNYSSHFDMTADINFPYEWCEDVTSFDDSRWPPVPKKTDLVMWVASNCDPQSKRGIYVKNLRKYIPVHDYGKCGDRNLSRKHDISNVFKNHKFYLAFKNSLCKEYVTEKLYRIISDDSIYVIPIVMGLDTYDMLPPDAVINIRDYSIPGLLAKHILYLDSNYEAFMKYFEWRKKRKCFLNTDQTGSVTLCGNCTELTLHKC